MRVLVLGGTGFIGSHLVDRLLLNGEKVRVFSRKPEQIRAPISKVDYRFADFRDTSSLAEALEGVDVVYHLISTTVPSTSNLDLIGDIQGNLISTVRLLEQMVKLGVRRIVYLSSGGTVYGNPKSVPVTVDQRLNPVCSYGVVKVAVEKYLFMFQEIYQLQPIVLRASNPYGSRQGHIGVQGVIPTFLKKMADGERLRIWGDGSVVRDYIYVSDLVDLCIKAGQSREIGVFNVGSGQGTSLNDLLEIITAVTSIQPTVEYTPGRAFDVREIVLDITGTKDAFKWQPAVNIETGIALYWQWFRENIS